WWWWQAAASMQTAKKRRATMASTAFLWARVPKWFMKKSMWAQAPARATATLTLTEAFLEEDSSLTMDTVQISCVDTTYRKTSARLAARAKLLVRERLMTNGAEAAKTEFTVYLEGEDSGADLVSRSVAKGRSHQEFVSRIVGTTRCTG